MLILTRESGLAADAEGRSTVRIVTPGGEEIILTLLFAERGRAKIGIAAPLTFQIWRDDCQNKEPRNREGM